VGGDRYGARYSWAVCAIGFLVLLPVYLFVAFVVVAFEESDDYMEAAAVTVAAVAAQAYVFLPGGHRRLRPAEQWAAGGD
jgi:hypothetical protein